MAERKRKWRRVEKGIYERTGVRGEIYYVRKTVAGKSVTEPFRTLSEAKESLKRYEKKASKIGGAVSKYADMNWAEFEEAKRHLPKGVSLVEAAIFYANANLDPERPRSFEAAMNSFLKLKERNVDPVTLAGYKTALLDIKARHGDKALEAISSRNLLEIVEELRSRDTSPVTIRNRHTAWKIFFTWTVRRKYVKSNVLDEIDLKTDLPAPSGSSKNPLELGQVQAVMKLFDLGCLDRNGKRLDISKYCLWAALQFFVGFRSSEAARFKYEWFDLESKSIRIPKWLRNKSTGENDKGAKTKDGWLIHDIEKNFWKWFDRQPLKESEGPIPVPARKAWEKDIRPALLQTCGLETWPHNAKRDSYATYHISLFLSADRTALVLKHKNAARLFESYLGVMVGTTIAMKYFSIVPEPCRRNFKYSPVRPDLQAK